MTQKTKSAIQKESTEGLNESATRLAGTDLPNPVGKIDKIALAHFTSPPEFKGKSGIFLIASIRNLGFDSIFEDWSVRITTTTGVQAKGTLVSVPYGQLVFGNYHGADLVAGSDALDRKTFPEPIRRGEAVRGFLFFVLDHNVAANPPKALGSRVALTFKDAFDKQYMISFTARKEASELGSFPGMQQFTGVSTRKSEPPSADQINDIVRRLNPVPPYGNLAVRINNLADNLNAFLKLQYLYIRNGKKAAHTPEEEKLVVDKWVSMWGSVYESNYVPKILAIRQECADKWNIKDDDLEAALETSKELKASGSDVFSFEGNPAYLMQIIAALRSLAKDLK